MILSLCRIPLWRAPLWPWTILLVHQLRATKRHPEFWLKLSGREDFVRRSWLHVTPVEQCHIIIEGLSITACKLIIWASIRGQIGV